MYVPLVIPLHSILEFLVQARPYLCALCGNIFVEQTGTVPLAVSRAPFSSVNYFTCYVSLTRFAAIRRAVSGVFYLMMFNNLVVVLLCDIGVYGGKNVQCVC